MRNPVYFIIKIGGLYDKRATSCNLSKAIKTMSWKKQMDRLSVSRPSREAVCGDNKSTSRQAVEQRLGICT